MMLFIKTSHAKGKQITAEELTKRLILSGCAFNAFLSTRPRALPNTPNPLPFTRVPSQQRLILSGHYPTRRKDWLDNVVEFVLSPVGRAGLLAGDLYQAICMHALDRKPAHIRNPFPQAITDGPSAFADLVCPSAGLVDDHLTQGEREMLIGLSDDGKTLFPPEDVWRKACGTVDHWTRGKENWFQDYQRHTLFLHRRDWETKLPQNIFADNNPLDVWDFFYKFMEDGHTFPPFCSA